MKTCLTLLALVLLMAGVSCKPPAQPTTKTGADLERAAKPKAEFLASLSNDALTDPELHDRLSADLTMLAAPSGGADRLELSDLMPYAKGDKGGARAAAIMWTCQLYLNRQLQAISNNRVFKRDTELEAVLVEAFASEDDELMKFQAAVGLAAIFGAADAEEYAVMTYLYLDDEDLDYLYWRQVTALSPYVPRIVARELVDGYEDVCLAFRLISRFEGDYSVDILLSYVTQIDVARLPCLCEAISTLGDGRFARPLVARFRKDAAGWDEETRRWVITALGFCRHEAALPILTDHIQSKHPVTRDAAAVGLRRIRPVDDGDLLAPYLLGVGDYASYVEKVDYPLTGLADEMRTNPFLPADRQTRLLGAVEELLERASAPAAKAALDSLREVDQVLLSPGARDILVRILGGD